MEGYNKVILTGNVADDPHHFSTKTGGSVAAFSIAVNHFWKGKEEEWKSAVDFHRVAAFGKWAEHILSHVQKGNAVLVEGRLVNRSFENAKGEKQFRTEVHLQKLKFMGPRTKKLPDEKGEEQVASPDAAFELETEKELVEALA